VCLLVGSDMLCRCRVFLVGAGGGVSAGGETRGSDLTCPLWLVGFPERKSCVMVGGFLWGVEYELAGFLKREGFVVCLRLRLGPV